MLGNGGRRQARQEAHKQRTQTKREKIKIKIDAREKIKNLPSQPYTFHVYHTLTQDCWGWMGNCLGGEGRGGTAASTRPPSPPTTVAPAAAPPPPLPPPPDPPAVPTFDEERLRELSTVVDLRETLLGFIKHGRGLVDEVAASCAIESSEDSSSRTAKAAHALKGAAKTIGASRLAHYAETIERKAKEGEACRPHVADLSAAYEDLATGVPKRTWS